MRKMKVGESKSMVGVEGVWIYEGSTQGKEHFCSFLPKTQHTVLANVRKVP